MKISSLALAFGFFLMILPFASASVVELSREGKDFSSTSGSYATSSHCISGQTCNWISGNQVIVGVYNANPSGWGGRVGWTFNVVNLSNIEKVELVIEWPDYFGKGLHSPSADGYGIVKVKDSQIAILKTNLVKCSPTNDYYAHECFARSLVYDVPLNLIESSSKVYIAAGSKTAWDVSKVKLRISYKDAPGTTGIKIENGKIKINGKEFLIKGMNYAPWLIGQGPEPSQKPFPASGDADVTALVTINGVRYVKDRNSDGKIQARELIRHDIETMQALGVNTIRIYATGSWHDRNLNGIQDSGEIDQGALPDWAVNKILNSAKNHNMKVIVGYWVQEEDFKTGMFCNWNDQAVARKTMKRIVDKWGNHSAVLAWGIGNEVHASWNQAWFSWGVNINQYLNNLSSYVKSIDKNRHPIVYAKYAGENANFNNLNADIIGVNAFTLSAQNLIGAGEFKIPAPNGKAYMLAEYGHDVTQASGHWALAKQYAGGAFLEYNDVWWKPGQADLGVVDEYRKARPERYNVLKSLYA